MVNSLSRRALVKLLGVAAPAPVFSLSLSSTRIPEGRQTVSTVRRFPEGFRWGATTAAYHVEGAVTEDGRGPSIWDKFSHTPGRVVHGDTGDVADDFYHRYAEDIQMMKRLGPRAFRFSVSWPRVIPNGTGAVNAKGLDYYDRLVNALLAAEIEPFCTLFHWDLPEALQDKGGWQSRDTAKSFADYAALVTAKLSGRVKHFMTMNEIRSFTLGYSGTRSAPGLDVGLAEMAQLTHHALLAHGLGVQAIRATASKGTQVGIAENVVSITPVIENEEHIRAAKIAMREENAGILTAILEAAYTERYLKRLGSNAPRFTQDEMQTIGSSLDFVGVNVYTPFYVRASASSDGYAKVPFPEGYPRMASPWLTVGPEGLYWVPRLVAEVWKPSKIYITENGASAEDTVTPEGSILDIGRVMYLRNYLMHLQRAIEEGFPVSGYFLWSLLDNFEWSSGYQTRFGIHYVDYVTQQRIPKLSAQFYSEVIARNAVA